MKLDINLLKSLIRNIVVKRPTRFSTLIDDAEYTWRSGEKGSGCYKQNKLQVKEEYNKRSRNNEPNVDDTYKRCMTRTKGTRSKERRQNGRRSGNDTGVARIMQNITRKRMKMRTETKRNYAKKT